MTQPASTRPAATSTAVPDRRSTTGWRARLRRTPGGAQLLKVMVFVLGLAFIVLGGVAVVLPGPWTIPPILLGLYVWSTEFRFADRWLDKARAQAQDAWRQAKAKPVVSALVTVAGLVALGVVVSLVLRYDLVDRAKDQVGL